MIDESVFSLPHRAIVLYFALRELGPMSPDEIAKRLGWSRASTYRAIRELRESPFAPSKTDHTIEVSYTVTKQTRQLQVA